MEILQWIDKGLSEIKESLIFSKYFDSILLEEGNEVYYLINSYMGIDIILKPNFIIKSIHFYSGNQEKVNKFTGELPFDLKFNFFRNQTRALLGIPNLSGGGEESILYGKIPSWDKYVLEGFALHLQFSKENGTLDLVTIDSLK